MTVTELFADIRSAYVDELTRAVSATDAFAEPALRRADGSLALDGSPPLPCRVDLIPRSGESAGKTVTVDSKTRKQFEPIHFTLGSMRTSVSSFTWDWTPIKIHGLAKDVVTPVLVAWFMQWFDPEDTNAELKQGLYGVLHFMSDPKEVEDSIYVDIDLGSVSEEALEELLFRLADVGAIELQVG